MDFNLKKPNLNKAQQIVDQSPDFQLGTFFDLSGPIDDSEIETMESQFYLWAYKACETTAEIRNIEKCKQLKESVRRMYAHAIMHNTKWQRRRNGTYIRSHKN